MAGAQITTDHDAIRKWAEARGGRPATVRSTHGHGPRGHGKGGTGIIRIEFPDAPNSKHDALEEISWEEFFEKFDESELALAVPGGDRRRGKEQLQQADRPRDRGSARARRQPLQPPPSEGPLGRASAEAGLRATRPRRVSPAAAPAHYRRDAAAASAIGMRRTAA